MTSKRKSAFSIYAENKPETTINELHNKEPKEKKTWPINKKNVQNNKYNQGPSNNTNGINSNANNKIVKHKANKNNKQIKNKFSKLPAEKITESIKMFKRDDIKSFNGSKNQIQELKMVLNGSNIALVPVTKKKAKSNLETSKQIPKKSEIIKNNSKSNEKSIPKHSTPYNSSIKEKVKVKKTDRKIFEENQNNLNAFCESSEEDDGSDNEMFDSRQEAIKLFATVIHPVKNKEFFNSYWEKKPLLIKRQNPSYYDLFSCKEFHSILKNQKLEFTQNIDITTYVNGVKQNHNLEGRAFAPLVWDFFQQGCSIRLLNPQTYSKKVWQQLSLLQELFGTCVGANIYLTPSGTQGFAPHYDDIEAFVLQLEGKKRWRVYKPLKKQDNLPIFSSQNFKENEISDPIIDVILERGDLLYFPRGYIHQANACDDIHSLHITVSCYQKNSWGEFLSKLMPGAVEIAMQEDVEFRKGLPLSYLINNGVAYDKQITNDRKLFMDKTAYLIKKLIEYAPIDAAVDQMGKQFIHDSLPPCLTKSEKSRSIHGHGEKWNEKKNRVENISEIEPDTTIKLIRKNCLRLVVEENSCFVYHNLENGRVYHEKEPQYLEVETEAAPAIEFLIENYPKYVTVEELPMKTIEEKIVVASCLYDKGLLVTGEPLECDFEENDNSSSDEYESKKMYLMDEIDEEEDENDIDEDDESECGNDIEHVEHECEDVDDDEEDEGEGEGEGEEYEIENEEDSDEENDDETDYDGFLTPRPRHQDQENDQNDESNEKDDEN